MLGSRIVSSECFRVYALDEYSDVFRGGGPSVTQLMQHCASQAVSSTNQSYTHGAYHSAVQQRWHAAPTVYSRPGLAQHQQQQYSQQLSQQFSQSFNQQLSQQHNQQFSQSFHMNPAAAGGALVQTTVGQQPQRDFHNAPCSSRQQPLMTQEDAPAAAASHMSAAAAQLQQLPPSCDVSPPQLYAAPPAVEEVAHGNRLSSSAPQTEECSIFITPPRENDDTAAAGHSQTPTAGLVKRVLTSPPNDDTAAAGHSQTPTAGLVKRVLTSPPNVGAAVEKQQQEQSDDATLGHPIPDQFTSRETSYIARAPAVNAQCARYANNGCATMTSSLNQQPAASALAMQHSVYFPDLSTQQMNGSLHNRGTHQRSTDYHSN